MNPFYEQSYEAMKHDLEICRNKERPFISEIECCYQAAEKHWRQLRNWLLGHPFTSIEEEIFFFKTIKPSFVAEAEYYRLLNFACNFCPDSNFPADQQIFRERQLNRLHQFKEKHADFYEYYQSGNVNLDVAYYTRDLSDNENYSGDKAASGYDMLTGQLLALQRYCEYAAEQLKICIEKDKEAAPNKNK